MHYVKTQKQEAETFFIWAEKVQLPHGATATVTAMRPLTRISLLVPVEWEARQRHVLHSFVLRQKLTGLVTRGKKPEKYTRAKRSYMKSELYIEAADFMKVNQKRNTLPSTAQLAELKGGPVVQDVIFLLYSPQLVEIADKAKRQTRPKLCYSCITGHIEMMVRYGEAQGALKSVNALSTGMLNLSISEDA